VPDERVALGQRVGANGSISPRNGTNSPKGTRRSFSTRSMTSPSGPKATAALWKCSPSPSMTPATRIVSSDRRGRTARPLAGLLDGPVDIDDVLGPDDEVDRRLDELRRGEVALEHLALVGVDGLGPLRTPALHGGDVDEAARRVTVGRDHRANPSATTTTAAAAPAWVHDRRTSAASATATATVTPPTSSEPPTRATPAVDRRPGRRRGSRGGRHRRASGP
jgi:hypothetical protein